MRQAQTFRLPALNLQPKEQRMSLSQEFMDYNISQSSVGYRGIDSSPMRRRQRGLTISVYNSQEKFKTAEYRNLGNAEFITQTQVNTTTVAQNTVKRYKTKLKQLMLNNQSNRNEEMARQRDPRLYSFKDGSATTIRLSKLGQPEVKHGQDELRDRIRSLMTQVRILTSTQSFYQAPQSQETYTVTMVRLKDEYQCLSQDFNEFYTTAPKKMDSQILGLMNHLSIIKRFLKPKHQTKLIVNEEPVYPQFQNISIDPPQQIIPTEKSEEPQPELPPPQPESESSVDEAPLRPMTPMTDTVTLEQEQDNISQYTDDSIESPERSPSKRKTTRIKLKLRNIKMEDIQQSNHNTSKKASVKNQAYDSPPESPSQRSLRDLLPSHSSRMVGKSTPSECQSVAENQPGELVLDGSESPTKKPPLKRNNSTVNKKRSTVVLQAAELNQSPIKAFKEESQSILEEEDDEMSRSVIPVQAITEAASVPDYVYEHPLLDKLIDADNIYYYHYAQIWDYHINAILDGDVFGEFDL